MLIKRFEDSITWQKAQDLAVLIYTHFRYIKDFSFRDQICRAAVSISNNIAEGLEKKGNKEKTHYLRISLGSCSEVRSMLYLAKRLNYIGEENQKIAIEKSIEVTKLLKGFIKSMPN